MSDQTLTFFGGPIFTGSTLLQEHVSVFTNNKFVETTVASQAVLQQFRSVGKTINLKGDILSPGFTDLQVNGGGGVMFNDAPSCGQLQTISTAHRNLGTVKLLPTLITDTPQKTRDAINACITAVRSGMNGISGLHLEGPHLSIAKKGAHDSALIRPMQDEDVMLLLEAASQLPLLKITLAPENASVDQVETLTRAGILVSLGHTNADYQTCLDYQAAGARCVTHLFNAMSQLGSREPGLVGAALDCENCYIGLIADGIHVHPATIRNAWKAKSGTSEFFLVSDAMAPAGTSLKSFHLNGRMVQRQNGRLTLPDGTLAGADLDLLSAIRVLHQQCGVPLLNCLKATITTPAKIVQANQHIGPCKDEPLENFIRIDSNLSKLHTEFGAD